MTLGAVKIPLARAVAASFAVTSAGIAFPERALAADRLDTISVTATRTQRTLFNTPDSVSVVSTADMERDQVQKLSDVLKNVPGVSFSSGPRAIAEKPIIRGMSGNRIMITIDGARQNFNSGHKGQVFVDPELLKSVEVLRGPGSAVYGSGAMGGVIAMQTRDAADFLEPGDGFGVRVKGGFASGNEEYAGTASVFGATDAAGGWDYLFSSTYSDSDDVETGGGETLDNSAQENFSALGKVSWLPGDFSRLTLSYQYNFLTGEVPAQADAPTSATAVLTDRETETDLTRLGYRYDNPDNRWLDLEAFTYYNAQTIREERIGTDGRLDTIDFDTTGVEVSNSSILTASGMVTQRLAYGLEYFEDEMTSRRGSGPNLAFPDASSQFYGAYLQDEITVEDSALGSWVFIPGVRYDHYESESDGDIADASDSTSESQVSPKFGLVFKAAPWMNLTFNYGQAFRAPDFQELYVSGVHFGANEFVPNPDLDPEVLVHGYEAGLRIKQRDVGAQGSRVELRLGAYYNEYEDFIDTIVTPLITTFDNISEARIKGVEVESSYYTPGLDARATLALSLAKGDNRSDNQPLTSVPGNSLVLGLEKYLPAQGLSVGARGSFHERQDRVADGQPETPGYSVFDVYVTWLPEVQSVESLQVTFGIDNLTDKKYTPHLANLPAMGQNLKVSVSVQF